MLRAFGRGPRYSWQTHIMRGYIPALIDLAAVRPTEGVKTGAMDLSALRTLPPSRVDGLAWRVTPLSLARLKFYAALRSSSSRLFLSFSFSFSFLFFFSYTPDLGSVIGPRCAPVLLLFVHSFRARSSELSFRISLTSCSHASLNPFPSPPRFSFTNFRVICCSVSFPSRRTGEPVFGARRYCTRRIRSSRLWLWLEVLPFVFYEREIPDPHGKLHEREGTLFEYYARNLV